MIGAELMFVAMDHTQAGILGRPHAARLLQGISDCWWTDKMRMAERIEQCHHIA